MEMRLTEGRSIKSSKDILELLQKGKLAARLAGKNWIPQWILTEESVF